MIRGRRVWYECGECSSQAILCSVPLLENNFSGFGEVILHAGHANLTHNFG
jgi:hypothetical protein